MQSSTHFAAWADPHFVFRMPDETPFGIDQSLHGRPIIDYQGQPSMHDNLRLQRLVQQLANKVKKLMDRQDESCTCTDSHQEVMALAGATFKEMSLQSSRADKALAVDTLWDSLSLYINLCATQAGAASAPESSTQQQKASATDKDAPATSQEGAQEPLSRTSTTSARLAALELENIDMKAQVASLNARLAQHAQHAEQLLAGTEAFFGDKAGTIIGQPLEEEDSDSNLSFTSAQERSFSRPMSAASSYDSACSRDLSFSSRSALPALHMRGLKGVLGCSKTLGAPAESGVSTASFETAREDALTRVSSGRNNLQQVDVPEEQEEAAAAAAAVASCPGGHGKRKALKAFLHKLRHAPAAHPTAAPDTNPASHAPPDQPEGRAGQLPEGRELPEGRAVASSRPSFGAAADRAAAQQFARSLSHKASLPASPEKQVMPDSPFAQPDAAGAGLDTSQQEVGAGVGLGAPPSMRVRTLSRQFSEGTQQQSQIASSWHTHRSLVPSRLVPDTASIPEEPVEEKKQHAAGAAPAGRASPTAPSSKASSKASSTRASSRSPSVAEESPGAAADQQIPQSTAHSAASVAAAPTAADKPSPKQRTVNRSLTSASPALVFGINGASASKLSRSTTGLTSATQQPFAFGSSTASKGRHNSTEQTLLQTPLQLGLGKAADAAASAGNVVGHLFGFSASDSAKSRPVFGGGLGSGFSFAAGSSSAGLPSSTKSLTRGVAAEAAAEPADAEEEVDGEKECGEEGEEEDGEEEHAEEEEENDEDERQQLEEGDVAEEGQQENQEEGKEDGPGSSLTGAVEEEDEDDCNFVLPDGLLSGDEEDTAAAAAINLPDSEMSHGELSEHDTAERSQSHAESMHDADMDDASHADGSELERDGEEEASQHDEEEAASQHDKEEAASQHDKEDTSHDTAGKAVEEGASNVLDAEQGSVERAELADAESMDEDVTGSTKESDDSQYEDGIEGDEASIDAALDNDEPSYVDSHEDFDPSSSDDESID